MDDPEIRRFQTETLGLLDEGLKRLDLIEKDIKELQKECLSRNPAAAIVADALKHADAETQFETIRKSRSALNKARAAIDRVLGRIAAPNIPAEISPAP